MDDITATTGSGAPAPDGDDGDDEVDLYQDNPIPAWRDAPPDTPQDDDDGTRWSVKAIVPPDVAQVVAGALGTAAAADGVYAVDVGPPAGYTPGQIDGIAQRAVQYVLRMTPDVDERARALNIPPAALYAAMTGGAYNGVAAALGMNGHALRDDLVIAAYTGARETLDANLGTAAPDGDDAVYVQDDDAGLVPPHAWDEYRPRRPQGMF